MKTAVARPLRPALRMFAVAAGLVALAGCEAHRPSFLALQPRQAAGCEALPDRERSTVVVFDPGRRLLLACNPQRAGERFVPASTFKIPHALIALDLGVTAPSETFAWDGRDRGVAAWNADRTLGQAISTSAVWVFQALAERIGRAREKAGVERLGYGNREIGAAEDLGHFWLRGPLKISALEQVDFLRRLREGDLPVSAAALREVRAMARLEADGQGNVVHGKTGAMLPIDDEGFLRAGADDLLPAGEERTGWFVGWLERGDGEGEPVYFATNLDLALPGAMAARRNATYAVLAANGYPVPAP